MIEVLVAERTYAEAVGIPFNEDPNIGFSVAVNDLETLMGLLQLIQGAKGAKLEVVWLTTTLIAVS